jgi:hypothetical protein
MNDFHIPFIKNLVIVGLVTIVSMVLVHYSYNFINSASAKPSHSYSVNSSSQP